MQTPFDVISQCGLLCAYYDVGICIYFCRAGVLFVMFVN